MTHGAKHWSSAVLLNLPWLLLVAAYLALYLPLRRDAGVLDYLMPLLALLAGGSLARTLADQQRRALRLATGRDSEEQGRITDGELAQRLAQWEQEKTARRVRRWKGA